MQIKTCPTCGSRQIARVKQTLRRKCKGRCYEVPDVEFWHCPACRERLFGRTASRKIDAASPAFARPTRARRKSA